MNKTLGRKSIHIGTNIEGIALRFIIAIITIYEMHAFLHAKKFLPSSLLLLLSSSTPSTAATRRTSKHNTLHLEAVLCQSILWVALVSSPEALSGFISPDRRNGILTVQQNRIKG